MSDIPRSTLVAWAVAALLAAAAVLSLVRSGGEPAPRVRLDPPAASAAARAAGPTPPATGGGAPAAIEGAGGAWVHVAGAVRRPGVYLVPARSRVTAAVDAAGGAARRADLTGVNLAAPVVDGQQVIVPVRAGRARPAVAPAGRSSSGGGAPGAAGAAGGPSTPLSLSAATQPELEELPGIGPALAGRIIAHREQHGGFRSVEELGEVEGIGPKRLEALRGAVRP